MLTKSGSEAGDSVIVCEASANPLEVKEATMAILEEQAAAST